MFELATFKIGLLFCHNHIEVDIKAEVEMKLGWGWDKLSRIKDEIGFS